MRGAGRGRVLWGALLAGVVLSTACAQPRAGDRQAVDAAPEVASPPAADASAGGPNVERPPLSPDAPTTPEVAAPARDAPTGAPDAPTGPAVDGPAGEPCTRHDDCRSGFCEGTCMAPFVAYPVPSRITDMDRITTGWDQGIWFTVGLERRIGRMTRTGMAREFTIPATPGPYPGEVDDVTNGPDSAVWFAMSNGRVGRVELDGTMAMFETGSTSAFANSTRVIVGPDRNIWYLTSSELYAISAEPGNRGKVLRTTPMGGSALVLGADGRVWVFYSSDATVFNADGSVAARHTLPTPITNSTVVVGPDNQIWYAGSRGFVRVNQQGVASMVEYPGIDRVVGLIVGPDGQLWFTEPRLNQMGRLNAGGDVTYLQLGGMNLPTRMTVGPDGALWFIDHGAGTINRLRR